MRRPVPLLLALALIPAAALGARAPAPPTEADWRTPDAQNVLVIDTTKGRILVELTPDIAPQATAQVRALAHSGFYDGLAFFRVVDNFMDQTGDPQNNGQGGSTRPNLPGEFTFRRGPATPLVEVADLNGVAFGFLGPMPVISQAMSLAPLTVDGKVKAFPVFCQGVVGMARTQDPDSGNSQFFLMRSPSGTLDQQYTAIGRVVSGMDVVRSIKTGEPVADPQDKMLSVKVLADMPAASRPRVRIIDPAGPWFHAQAAALKAAKDKDFSACDLDIPVEIR